jgi:hypothetical protein
MAAKKKTTSKITLPTDLELVDVMCPVCGARDQAKLIRVTIPGVTGPVFGTCMWLQMPAGWAHTLPLNWIDCRRLAHGLARCPRCVPKPVES